MTQDAARTAVYTLARGKCWVCRKPVPWPGQLAHRIPQSRAMLRRYGVAVIHHPINLRLVCGLACNDAVSISNHPVQERELVRRIEYEIRRPKAARHVLRV